MANAADCLEDAARHYGVDLRIARAVLRVEGGRPGLRSHNANGTYDIGPMQINSSWLPRLAKMGISEDAITWDYCANVAVGMWILGRELKAAPAATDKPEFWQAVGRYNSRTPRHNAIYAVKVWHQAKKIQSGTTAAN